jgi:hypothetical protein
LTSQELEELDKLLAPPIEDELTPEEQSYEIERCKRDGPVYFINTYGFVLEPRPPILDEQLDLDFDKYLKNLAKDDPLAMALDAFEAMPREAKSTGHLPFKLWDYQIELILWFDWLVMKGESGCVAKSRDMGYTWLYVWWCIYHWRFTPGFSALLGSKKEAAVDNATLSSIFGKLDYAIEKLPDWLKPKGYVRRLHRTRLRIMNPENGNYLVGDSQTQDFGASERHTVVIPDETALWDFDPSGTVSNTTNTAIYGSSVRGENHFKRLHDRLLARSASLVRELKWNLNKTHTPAWFAAMQARMDEADFAREVLIDWQAAVKGKYYPVASLVKQGEYKWEAGWPSVNCMDYGVSDNTALIWWQASPEKTLHRMMFCYTNAGKPIDFYIPFLLAKHPDHCLLDRDRSGVVRIDEQGREVYRELTREFVYTEDDLAFIALLQREGVTSSVEFRGDPAGKQRSQDTATSVITKLSQAGVEVMTNTKLNDYLSRRTALTDVLLKTEVNKAAWAAWNAIAQSKYPERSENSQATTVPAAPVHDWTSHYRSAAEYYAVGEVAGSTVSVVDNSDPYAAATGRSGEGVTALMEKLRGMKRG